MYVLWEFIKMSFGFMMLAATFIGYALGGYLVFDSFGTLWGIFYLIFAIPPFLFMMMLSWEIIENTFW